MRSNLKTFNGHFDAPVVRLDADGAVLVGYLRKDGFERI